MITVTDTETVRYFCVTCDRFNVTVLCTSINFKAKLVAELHHLKSW
jgi:hypothetical protein